MALNYKKRRSYLSEDARTEAVRRIQAEASVRSKMTDSGPRSHGGSPDPGTGTGGGRPKDTGPRSHGGSPNVPPGPKTPIPAAQQPIQKNTPQEQQQAAERARARANYERPITSHGGAVVAPERGGRKFATIRGPHRLSFRQAYSRRTTDTSRARVLKLYGRSSAPRPKPSGALDRSGGEQGAGLNKVAQMRSKINKGARRRGRLPLPGNNSGRRYL